MPGEASGRGVLGGRGARDDKSSAKELACAAVSAAEAGRRDEALSRFADLRALYGESVDGGVRAWVVWGLTHQADVLEQLGLVEEALSVLDEVIARFDRDDDSYVSDSVDGAFDQKANVLRSLGRGAEELALREVQVARARARVPVGGSLGEARALAGVASALSGLGRLREATKAWTVALGFVSTLGDEARDLEAWALVGRSRALHRLGDYAEALAGFEQVLSRFGDVDGEDEDAARVVAAALWGEALAAGALGRTELRATALDQLTGRFSSSTRSWAANAVTRALFMRAEDFRAAGDLDQADALYDHVLKRGPGTSSASRAAWVNAAELRARGMWWEQGDPEGALAALDRYVAAVEEQFAGAGADADAAFAQLMSIRMNLLAGAWRDNEVRETTDAIVGRLEASSDSALRARVAAALRQRFMSLSRLGRSDEAESVFEEMAEHYGDEALAMLERETSSAENPADPQVRGARASALLMRGALLDFLGRSDESARTFASVIERYQHDDDASVVAVAELARVALMAQECE
jgi:tetratricopeptide (TPR) repeat protein